MKLILGWSIVVIVGGVLLVNALFMLFSPRKWFQLPSWILAKGTLTEKKYASGWGGIEVRLAGAAMLAVLGWVLHDALMK